MAHTRTVSIVGAATGRGAGHPGCRFGPQALRHAGLASRLSASLLRSARCAGHSSRTSRKARPSPLLQPSAPASHSACRDRRVQPAPRWGRQDGAPGRRGSGPVAGAAPCRRRMCRRCAWP